MRLSTLGVAALILTAAAAPAAAQTVRISVATDGTLSNDSSITPVLSRDGRFVAFVSYATNLVPGDTNGVTDIFLRDRDTNANGVFDEPGSVSTVRVSQNGATQANAASFTPAITPDGRYVFFETYAGNLFAFGQPPLPFTEVLRWARQTGEIVLVSRNDAGEPLNQANALPAPTADGNTVYFVTYASNGPVASIGAGGMLVRRDIAAGTLTAVTDPLPAQPGLQKTVEYPSVSDDGRVLAFGIAERNALSERVGGTIVVKETGRADRTYPGVDGHLSDDGAFLLGTQLDGDGFGQAFRLHLRSGDRRAMGPNMVGVAGRTAASGSGRYLEGSGAFYFDFLFGSWVANFFSHGGNVGFDAIDHWVVYVRSDLTATRQFMDLFAVPIDTYFDNDSDGLNDHWETTFGLDTFVNGATGDNGPDGDPDHDGLTNAQELAAGSNPVGTVKRFLAEGTSSADFFSTRIAVVNPGSVDAKVAVRYDAGSGVGSASALTVPARSRVTLDSHAERMDGFSFSTVVDSDRPLVVDRLVSWGAPEVYGSHAETSAAAPATSWFLAEGSTVLGFQLFYLLQNPQPATVTATIRFLLPAGAPIVRTYELPARSRTTVFVNDIPGLAATDVSADISATQPIAVERAMYRSSPRLFELGHDASGIPAAATRWVFAEGTSNAFFDTYLLIANPSASPATVEVAYLRDEGGPLVQTHAVAAGSRFSIFVDDVPGLGAASYGLRVISDVPIVAERAMYWAGGFFDYYEGHVSAGATAPGSHWVLAESEIGTSDPALPFQAVSFVLVANTGTDPATFRVRTLPEAGGAPLTSGLVSLPGGARVTIPLSTLLANGRFGVDVLEEGTATGALIVEGAIYWSTPGQPFAAGANWFGTPVP